MTDGDRSAKRAAFSAAVEDARQGIEGYYRGIRPRAIWYEGAPKRQDSLARQYFAFSTFVGKLTDSLEGWRILDYGCGAGAWLRRYLEMDARPADIMGVDISEELLEQGRRINPLVRMVHFNGWQIPCDSDSFDVVTQFNCFTSIPTHELRQTVASEIRRVLKPGGHLFWWDLLSMQTSRERGAPIAPGQYFSWNIDQMRFGQKPRPSECIRPSKIRSSRIVKALIGRAVDRLRYPDTHLGALIGPKPGLTPNRQSG